MNELHYCPNCAFLLVLLERRGKYKCAKCSRIYLIKEVEDRDFKEWNLKQRIEDKEQFEREEKRKYSKSEQGISSIKKWREKNKEKLKEYWKEYYKKNKQKMLEKNHKYYKENKEMLCEMNNNNAKLHRDLHLKRCKDYYFVNREDIINKRKSRRLENLERSRLLSRISFWRKKQKMLTLQMLEKQQYKAYNSEFWSSLPTNPHSYLLTDRLILYNTISL